MVKRVTMLFVGLLAGMAMLFGTAVPAAAGTSGWYTTGSYGELRCYNQWTASDLGGASCQVASGYWSYWRVQVSCSWGGTYSSVWRLQDGDDGLKTLWAPTNCTWGINSITVQYHY